MQEKLEKNSVVKKILKDFRDLNFFLTVDQNNFQNKIIFF